MRLVGLVSGGSTIVMVTVGVSQTVASVATSIILIVSDSKVGVLKDNIGCCQVDGVTVAVVPEKSPVFKSVAETVLNDVAFAIGEFYLLPVHMISCGCVFVSGLSDGTMIPEVRPTVDISVGSLPICM